MFRWFETFKGSSQVQPQPVIEGLEARSLMSATASDVGSLATPTIESVAARKVHVSEIHVTIKINTASP